MKRRNIVIVTDGVVALYSLTQGLPCISSVLFLHFRPIHAFTFVVSKQLKVSYPVVNLRSYAVWLVVGDSGIVVYVRGGLCEGG